MKLSFHNHTEYSWDSKITLSALEAMCVTRGVDAITITDHNEVAGALEAVKRFTKVRVIVGEEINTQEGEVVGLFLTKRIEPDLPLATTLSQIHAQGGIAIVVHPFDRLRKHVLETDMLHRHLPNIDVVEVFNSRTVFSSDNIKALHFAIEHKKPQLVGNDAHTVGEVGMSVVELPDFTDGQSFLASLSKASFITQRSPLWVHGVTKLVKWTHRYRAPK